MRRNISLCLLFCFIFSRSVFLHAEEESRNGHTDSEPSAVLIERDPWLIVPGSDTPRVVLYDNGTLIWLKKYDRKQPLYMVKALDRGELKKLRKSVRLTDRFMKLRRYYRLTDITDAATVEIYMSDGNRSKAVSVYGMRQETSELPAAWLPYEMQNPDKLPDEFRRVYDAMADIEYPDAEVWIPTYIEVLIWPYRNSPEKPLLWPENWPTPDDPLTRRHENSYSLYMRGNRLGELKAFLSGLKQKQAVFIDKRKWSVSYRFVFSGESVWWNTFNKKD